MVRNLGPGARTSSNAVACFNTGVRYKSRAGLLNSLALHCHGEIISLGRDVAEAAGTNFIKTASAQRPSGNCNGYNILGAPFMRAVSRIQQPRPMLRQNGTD
jgi:hypothetical protein